MTFMRVTIAAHTLTRWYQDSGWGLNPDLGKWGKYITPKMLPISFYVENEKQKFLVIPCRDDLEIGS